MSVPKKYDCEYMDVDACNTSMTQCHSKKIDNVNVRTFNIYSANKNTFKMHIVVRKQLTGQ